MSKVSLSVCALMVVSVLGGLYGGDMLADTKGGLSAIGREVCILIESLSSSGSCGLYCLSVSFLPSGDAVRLVLGTRSVTVTSNGESVMLGLPSEIHTWAYEGQVLNSSVIRNLDLASSGVEATSGGVIEFRSAEVAMEDDSEMLVFVSSQG